VIDSRPTSAPDDPIDGQFAGATMTMIQDGV
jgi:hypothetical protein